MSDDLRGRVKAFFRNEQDFTDWVGRKVNLVERKFDHRLGSSSIFEIEDPVFEKEIKEAFPRAVLMPPGSVITADVDMTRVQVHISEKGIITSITRG